MARVSVNQGKLLQAIILLFFTVFLVKLLLSHNIFMLVSPMIADVIKVSIFLFGLVTFVALLSCVTIRKSAKRDPHHQSDDGDRTHDHHHHDHGDCDHDHHHISPVSRWGRATFALCALALVAGFFWQPKALGTNMLAQSGGNASLTIGSANNKSPNQTPQWPSPQPSGQPVAVPTGIAAQQPGQESEATVAIDYEADPGRFLDKPVSLEGFVYHPAGLPSNHFILTRYFIFCCIADASPMGIVVSSPASGQLQNDTWVKVDGQISKQRFMNVSEYAPTTWYPTDGELPILVANAVSKIAQPQQPYMMPNY